MAYLRFRTAMLVLLFSVAAARVPSSPYKSFPKLDAATARGVLAATAATWSIRRLACSRVEHRRMLSADSINMLPATVSYANAEMAASRTVAYKVALKRDLGRLATVPPVANLPTRQLKSIEGASAGETKPSSQAASAIEEEWKDAMLSNSDEMVHEPTAMLSGNRAAWIADEVFSDRFGSCSFRVVTRRIPAGSFGMATHGDRARRFFGGFGSGLKRSSSAASRDSGTGSDRSSSGSDSDSSSDSNVTSGGRSDGNSGAFPKWRRIWNQGNRRHSGAQNVEVVRVEVRLQGFGTAQTTRACLDALSSRLDEYQPPRTATLSPIQLPGLPHSPHASFSSPSSSSSSTSAAPFPVYIDMIESSAASPRTIPLVVGFLRHVGERFDKVSLVGTGPSMGTARAIIAIARLQKFRVFPNFKELQRAVAEKKW